MAPSLEDLLRARATRAFDVDSSGRILVGDDRSGSVQLYEVTPDGVWTTLTDLGESCRGRYLPDERAVVVEHDAGGNERGQLSLLRLDGGDLTPLVHDDRYVHNILETLPGRVVFATNRRNGVDFDVAVVDVKSGAQRMLYDSGGWSMEVAVSPDEKHVVLGRPGGAAHSSQLLLVAGDEVTELSSYDEPALYEQPCWEPSGTGFFFTTNSGREFCGIARYDVATSSWEYLSTDGAHDLTGWLSPDGSKLLVVTLDDGAETAAIHDAATGTRLSTVDTPTGVLSGRLGDPVWAPDASAFALTITSPTEPGDVYLCTDSATTRLTDSSAALEKSALVTPTSHRIPSPDGEQIPCFLYPAPDGAGSVVVLVHGGPEAASLRSWNPMVQALALAGHTVAVPNVRGSTGYGKRWYALDDVRLRLDSVADMAALHAWLPSVGLDQQRAALYGGSYGGYMVLAGVTMQPSLWAAAVDIVGISSLVTFLENTSAYRRAAREREYGSLANDRDFLESASPLTHIDNVRAPLFIIHGANDPRVPLSEAEQVAAAVRATGAECEMHVYDDEGHGLAKLHNKLHAYPRAVGFLARHLS